jgi:hypothetical protein
MTYFAILLSLTVDAASGSYTKRKFVKKGLNTDITDVNFEEKFNAVISHMEIYFIGNEETVQTSTGPKHGIISSAQVISFQLIFV